MKIYSYNGSKNVIGPTVRRLRLNQKLTQKALAEQMQLRGVDLSPVTILRIEKQKRFVTDYEVLAFAHFFQIMIEDLYPIVID